jgi:hypothetical protein
METMNQEAEIQRAVEKILKTIIDEWYERVSGYYVTQEQVSTNPGENREVELKKFHDEKGHRIKFSKDELDFTYGLRSNWLDGHLMIEVSVNNKVENFDYDDFQERLVAHYEKTGNQKVQTPAELRNITYRDVFAFEPSIRVAFTVEKREDKADIMRLSFKVNNQVLEKLAAHPIAGKQLVEAYCVSPFRSVYATVYRRSSR